MDNSRNLVLAVLLCAVLLFGWDFAVNRLYPQPAEKVKAEQVQQAQTPAVTRGTVKHSRDGGLTDPGEIAEEQRDIRTALATPGRVPIDSTEVAGSLDPVGARIDDVVLKTHRQTVDKDSGPVRLFSPSGTPAQQFAQFGWVGEGVATPDAQTRWQSSGGKLTEKNPVIFTWANAQGQTFRLRFAIDQFYMLTVEADRHQCRHRHGRRAALRLHQSYQPHRQPVDLEPAFGADRRVCRRGRFRLELFQRRQVRHI